MPADHRASVGDRLRWLDADGPAAPAAAAVAPRGGSRRRAARVRPAAAARSSLTASRRVEASATPAKPRKRRHVAPIVLAVVALRRLQDAGMLGEALVVEEQAKRFAAQLAFADVRVPVDAAPRPFFESLRWKTRKPVEADDVVECLHRGRVDLRVADVVAGGKDVAGVEADPDAGLVLDQRQDRGQLLE